MNVPRIGLVDWRLSVSGKEAVLLAARVGADGIQLDFGGPGRAPWLDFPGRLTELRSALAQSGVAPLAISINVLNDLGLTAKKDTARADQVRRVIIRAMNTATKLNVGLVLLPSFRRSAIEGQCAFARTAAILKWACAEARDRGQLLATENVLAPEQLRQLIALVDSSNLRVMLDTGNTSKVGLDPVDIVQAAGPILATQIHIKNANERAPLSTENRDVLKALTELYRIRLPVDALVLENDYRDRDPECISNDLGWLRTFFKPATHRKYIA
jgi:2-epi-5-epi-valiolone 7-phosphate 2-epimerase